MINEIDGIAPFINQLQGRSTRIGTMPLLSKIDITGCRTAIAEKVSLLIDPVLNEIPDDPVFVHYLHPEKCTTRLFSKTQIQLLKQQVEMNRKILDELREDKTGICVALKYAENLSQSEQRYKAFLLKMSDLTREKIMSILEELYKMALHANSRQAYIHVLLKLQRFLYKDIDVYFREFQTLVAAEKDAKETSIKLWNFLILCF